MRLSSTLLGITWGSISMGFVHSWKVGLLMRKMAAGLSQIIGMTPTLESQAPEVASIPIAS